MVQRKQIESSLFNRGDLVRCTKHTKNPTGLGVVIYQKGIQVSVKWIIKPSGGIIFKKLPKTDWIYTYHLVKVRGESPE